MLKSLLYRLKMAWFGFKYPSIATTVQQINGQLRQGTRMGLRGTPVVSFWPLKPKWEGLGYWETHSTDGDPMISSGGLSFAPAKYRIIYFRIPNSKMVCQLAFETAPGKASAWDDYGNKLDNVSAYALREAIIASKRPTN